MKHLLLLFCLLPLLSACDTSETKPEARPQLLIYCGITMVNPIKEIAMIVEKEKNIDIIINQGGSEDLYKSLASSKMGDLYLPGSASYRKNHLDEGLLGDAFYVGYNQASFIVAKGNPKHVTADLNQVLRDDLDIIIGNADTSSIGRETKRILDTLGLYQKVLEHTVFVTTDSRNLNTSLRDGIADLIINWKATAFFAKNIDHMQVIELDENSAPKKQLLLNKLTFSKYPELSQYFIDVATSEKGKAIFRRFGFLE